MKIFPRVAAIAALVAIAVVLVAAMQGGTSSDTATAAVAPDPTDSAVAEPTPTPTPIPVLRTAPTLSELDGWLNSGDTTLEEIIAGNDVTVVQFWTYDCFNCVNTLPAMRQLYENYGDDGLEIVGVHAPEFSYERDPDNVAQALVDLDVTWPVALDTERLNFRFWQDGGRRFWPRTYIIDSEGNIRFDHIGEGKYTEIDETVARLLAER